MTKIKLKPRKEEEKTNIGVLLPVAIYKQFQILCLEKNRRPGELLTEIMEKFLKREEGREKRSN